MRVAAMRLVPWIVLSFTLSACSESSPSSGDEGGSTATPTVSITSPEDGSEVTAAGDRADVSLSFELSDSLSDDVVDCLVGDVSAGVADGNSCVFSDLELGEHVLGVAVLQSTGEAYTNDGARASVTITVVGTSCTSASDCDDNDPCTLDVCEDEGRTCAYFASPIAGCESDFSTYECKEDSDCALFLEGQGSCASALCDSAKNVCYVTVLAEEILVTTRCLRQETSATPRRLHWRDLRTATTIMPTEECVEGEGCQYTDVVCNDDDACTIGRARKKVQF